MRAIAQAENDDFKDSLFSKAMQNTCVKTNLIDLSKEVKLNKIVPNFKLFQVINHNKVISTDMESVQHKGIPLVLNFGSCS